MDAGAAYQPPRRERIKNVKKAKKSLVAMMAVVVMAVMLGAGHGTHASADAVYSHNAHVVGYVTTGGGL